MEKSSVFFMLLTCITLFFISNIVAMADNGVGKYYNLAISLQKQKKYKEAQQVYDIAISKYPNVSMLYFYRAELKKGYMGNCVGAIQDYTNALRFKTKLYGIHPKAFYQRGICLFQSKQYLAALNDFNNSLRLKPNYGRVYLERARTYLKLNMPLKAKQDLKRLIQLAPHFKSKANQIVIKYHLGSTF